MQVATHDGSFHADDVFAIATLRLTDPGLTVVRTRDRDAIAAADARVDIGLKSDPATGDYDHHQKGGAGTRANGIPFASFGLVWRAHGPALCGGDEQVAAVIDDYLVQGIDALDTGLTLTSSVIDDVRPLTVSDMVSAMNPVWDEETTPEYEDALFHRAVDVAAAIIERQIHGAVARVRAHRLVREAIARATDPRIIELDRSMPWHEPIVEDAPEAQFVIYPRSDGWGLKAVPRELGAFGNRKDLPAAWAGLSGPELAELTGVQDAVFCHTARFMAATRTRDGVVELARQAVADEE